MNPLDYFGGIRTVADYNREAEEFEARRRQRMMEEQLAQGKLSMLPFEQQKMQAEAKAAMEGRGAGIPATIQIANEMQRAKASGDMERFNLLNQVHKTMDRGLYTDPTTGAIAPMQGYGQAVGGIEAAKTGMSREAEKNVDLTKNPQIAGAEANARLAQELTMKPKIDAATSNAVYAAEKEQKRGKATATLRAVEEQYNNVNNTLSDIIDQSGNLSVGWANALLTGLPETRARSIESLLKTVNADAAFSTLQQMRDNSPTGGALGSVAASELDLLKNARAALDPNLEPNEFIRRVNNYMAARSRTMENVRRAYLEDYPQQAGQNNQNQTTEQSTVGSEGIIVDGPAPPVIGEIRGRYMFVGGDPADPKSWKKVR